MRGEPWIKVSGLLPHDWRVQMNQILFSTFLKQGNYLNKWADDCYDQLSDDGAENRALTAGKWLPPPTTCYTYLVRSTSQLTSSFLIFIIIIISRRGHFEISNQFRSHLGYSSSQSGTWWSPTWTSPTRGTWSHVTKITGSQIIWTIHKAF